MSDKHHAEILKRARLLQNKLDQLVERVQQSANNAALAVIRLEAANPDYLGVPSSFTSDLVALAASADRNNGAFEALLFQLIDDNKLLSELK